MDTDARETGRAAHQARIRDQFTRQAVPFSTAPGIKDEAALRLLVEATAAGPADRVLDVACGPGLVCVAFARTVRHAVGIDVTPAMIERARAIQAEQGVGNVSFCVGDVAPLPCASRAFSIVTSRFAFHHLREPAAALAEMTRACRPGGRVALVDVMASPEPEKARAYDRMETLRDPSHVRALTLAEMRGLFEASDLGEPGVTFYRLEAELEGVLSRSFPEPGGADAVREMFRDSLEDDGLGVGARLEDGQIRFAYPIAILVATTP